MKRTKLFSFMIMALLTLALCGLFTACGGDDDTTIDGDTADGDTADGDTTDGDTVDGDTVDGDTTDGDTADGDTVDGDTTDGDADVHPIYGQWSFGVEDQGTTLYIFTEFLQDGTYRSCGGAADSTVACFEGATADLLVDGTMTLVSDTEIQLKDEGGQYPCPSDQLGNYSIAFSDDDNTVTLTLITDDCTNRSSSTDGRVFTRAVE